ncbi:EamA-like transporter family protein [Anaerobacterium chartisolvens]|uniref:EamA-like transporter family protein n=1 Tax=Anaerobacterium chartisolvens TaxID=1297424 RepID=A0A369BDT7_9FIRM|nr:EamA family transporter [Anaerobacterium chartisolvens]RCX18768.1 EamA-like transporter family protein [Anaerobacterium chartisolvens]
MLNFIWPIFVVVAANTVYNICAKSTPAGVQPFASLAVTYLTAAFLSVLLFFATSGSKDIVAEARKIDWTSLVFGCSIVALEFGYIYIYRVGWKVSTGSLIANVCLACVLLVIGIVLYKESITLRQIAGMVLCIAGIFMISK